MADQLKTARTTVTVKRLTGTGSPVCAMVERYEGSADPAGEGAWRQVGDVFVIDEGSELNFYLDADESVKVWE